MFSEKSTNENSETKIDGSSQSQEDSCNHSSCNSVEDLPPLTSDDEKYLNYAPSSDEGEASLSGKVEADAKPAALETKSPSEPPESMSTDRKISPPKDMIKEETIKDTNETNISENEEGQKISANDSYSEEILKIKDELELDHLGINSLPLKHDTGNTAASDSTSSPDTTEENEIDENEARRPVFTFGSASASSLGNAETTEINATATPTFATSFQVNSQNSFSIGVTTGNSAARGLRSRRANKRRRSDDQQNEEIIVEDVDSEEDEDEDYDDLDVYDEDEDEDYCDCEYCMNEGITRGAGGEISMPLYDYGESDDDASDEMPPLIDRHISTVANSDNAPQENADDSDSDDSSYRPEDDTSEDSESYADDDDSDDDSEGDENMPVLISRQEAANYSDSSDLDSNSDSDSASNDFGDMPALVVRRNDSSSSSSSYESSDDDEDLSIDIEDENEIDDDETNQCAICFMQPSYGNSFVVLPCCGVSDQTDDGGNNDTSTTRFCHNCMVKTLQGNSPMLFGLGMGYSQDPCVGECPRCRSLLAVNRNAYGSQSQVIDKVTLTQAMEYALKRENADYFDIFATLSYANPIFLPSELGGPSDNIGQLCSWGIVTKKKGKKKGRDIYQMEKKDQLEMRNYLENHILTAAKDVSIRMVASANMMAAICYTFLDFKIWRCLRLINSMQPVVISFVYKKFPEIEEEWQEILMAVLTSYLFLLVAQVALVLGAYLAIAYVSIRYFAQIVEGVKTIRSRLNEADYSSLSRVYQTIVIPKEVKKWKCVFFLLSVHWFVRGAFTVNRFLYRITTCLYGWRLESFLYFVRHFFEGKDNTSAAVENVSVAVTEVVEGEL